MPDWTYHPLRRAAAMMLGERRSQRAALRVLAALTTLPGGRRAIIAVFDHARDIPEAATRLGAVVPVEVAAEAMRVLPAQGAAVIEIGPVGPADVDRVKTAVADRRCRVTVRASSQAVAAELAPHVDLVFVDDQPPVTYVREPDIEGALRALTDERHTVLAIPAVLVAAGPGWFQRIIEALTPTERPPTLRDVPLDPRRWPAWWWGLLVGVGMIGAGIGAAAITLGPVLLWYDRDYLGTDRDGLHMINHHLVHFLQHDRLTMAGTMVSIGILYLGLSWGGIRRGRRWARNAYALSGWIAFPTLLYFLAFGFVEPLHTAVAVVLFPMFLAATWHSPAVPRWTVAPEGSEAVRRRALVGQLLMIITGIGLFIGGLVVSIVGLTTVFVPTDLTFLNTDSAHLKAANPDLLPFIAHDRAGFGGALMAAATAVTLLSLWGWRRGEAWVWWTLATSAAAGFGPALVIHGVIHYTSFEHLLPVYIGTVLVIVALTLARPYLTAKSAATSIEPVASTVRQRT